MSRRDSFAAGAHAGAENRFIAGAMVHFAMGLVGGDVVDMSAAKDALGKAFRLDLRMREPAPDDLRLAVLWRTVGG